VVAEGIETVLQLKILNEAGIKSGQGFLFSPAVCFNEFISLCAEGDFHNLLAHKAQFKVS
jgi:sensor c-di-GMP phosphodiesterase-like protein